MVRSATVRIRVSANNGTQRVLFVKLRIFVLNSYVENIYNNTKNI